MPGRGADILIGVDAGTSVIKAVAFDLAGRQLAVAATPNRYHTRADGAAVQPLGRTWDDCAATLRKLGEAVPDLAARTAALAVTAQGDGTWLVGAGDEPVADAWLWLDSRAAPTAARLRADPADARRYQVTGTGLNACQMGTQLAHMQATAPEMLDRAEVALHGKDWLYLKLTGVRATDPTEGVFTFGDFRTRAYDADVVAALGLAGRRHLLPEIVDGTATTHPLTAAAAAETGLAAGTPVALGFVDVICTGLGAGVWAGGGEGGCTVIGSTGVHMRATTPDRVALNEARTGYVMALPVPGMVAQLQMNMSATLNIDWLLALAADLSSDLGQPQAPADLLARLDGWIIAGAPGELVYHPYISEAGERAPFVNHAASAAFAGLRARHRFPDLVRAVVEGLGMAARDCYSAMGEIPPEIRLTGGAARSAPLRGIFAAATGAPVRTSARAEAGAAGAAMIAAVATGAYPDMRACIADWVAPHLSQPEPPDPDLARRYQRGFDAYRAAREALAPVWDRLEDLQEGRDA